MRLRNSLLFLILVLGTIPSRATVYFVDAGLGADGRTKRQARVHFWPWKHLQVAVDSAAAGDTLVVAGGYYRETLTLSKRLVFLGESAPITFIQPPDAAGFGPAVVTIAAGVDGAVFSQFTIDGNRSASGGAMNGILCNAGVDSLTLDQVIVQNCIGTGLMTSFNGTADGKVNDGFRIANCSFVSIAGGRPGNQPSCAIWGDHLSHLLLTGTTIANGAMGLWLGGTAWPDTSAGTGNVVSACVFQDLADNAVVCAGISHLRLDSCTVRRCDGFGIPDSAWTTTFPGAVSIAGHGTDNVLTACVIHDNFGPVGTNTFYTNPPAALEGEGYNGWPAVFASGNAGLTIQYSTIYLNRYGGVFLSGAGAYTVTDNYIYSNGELNAGGRDYGLVAPAATVTAGSDWWGSDAGPGSDGAGPRNTVVGAGVRFTGGHGPRTANNGFVLRFSPDRMIFNVVHISDHLDMSCRFWNAGVGPAFTHAPSIAAAPDQYAVLSPTAAQVLNPGDSITVVVRFSPTLLGFINGRVVLGVDTTVPDVGPQLLGFGGLPVLQTADTLFFDTLAPGRCTAQTLQIRNVGTEMLQVDSVQVQGLDAGDFAVEESLPLQLFAGDVEDLHVSYCPADTGERRARLIFYGNTLPSTTYVELRAASATVSRLTVAPPTVDLGLIHLGQAVDTAFRVTNTASVPLALDTFQFASDTVHVATFGVALPVAIPSGATLRIPVHFAPTMRGVRSYPIVGIAHDGTRFGAALRGGGGIVQITRSTDTLFHGVQLGVGDQREECMTFTNTGDFDLGIFLAQLSGANTDEYTIEPVSVGILSPGGQDTMCVRFHPVRTGHAPCVVQIQYTDAALAIDSVALDATGTTTGVAEGTLPGTNELAVLPNPVRAEMAVRLAGVAGGRVRVTIVDAVGRTMFNRLRDADAGVLARVPTDSWAPGVYLVRAMQGTRSWSGKAVVVR